MAEKETKITGYCVKCKENGREIKNPKNTTIKGRAGTRPAVKGNCAVCGTGMFRIGATV
ncbi:MAG: hypothetical protein HYT16_04190 [DPANN group archaeon]|nr:hypothetical protein [DPANN group archaeon]